ncbi:MAG: Gfo/Idh/MocA family protein [Lachnospiraceae bacterium]|jgi:dihydrodiol dehydrogenase / D-xylose 1-dehydrogenase (NADP)
MNAKEKIKWGFMGAGRICGWMAEAMSVIEDAEKYVIASRTLEKAQAFAAKHGFTKAYGSYEEMLSDPEVDIVYIGTPVSEHFKHIKMCLEAGKNVLCEKSLTLSGAEAREAVKMAREKNLFLMEAMWMKCQPAYRKVKEWIANGLMGEIQAVDVRFYTAAGKGHRLYDKSIAGGALLDLGVYPITYACDMLGYHPEQIISNSVIGQTGVDYFDSIVMTYPGGKTAHCSTGLGSEKMVSVFLLGSKGRVTISKEFFFQAQSVELLDFDSNVIDSFSEPFMKNGYEYEAIEAMKCLREGKIESDLIKLDDTVAVMEILDKIAES